jgi:GcrA cell cycle regulator
MAFEWNEQSVETLRRLWSLGWTAEQIACEMHCPSRNASCGKAHRLGLSGRPSPIKRNGNNPGGIRMSMQSREAHPPVGFPSLKQGAHPGSLSGSAAADARRRAAKAELLLPFTTPAQSPADAQVVKRSEVSAAPLFSGTIHEPDNAQRNVRFADLAVTGCKWATTPHHVRSDEHRFCNAPREPLRAWCADHCEKARGKPTGSVEGLSGIDLSAARMGTRVA